MARLVKLQDDFSRGFRQDTPRDRLPRGTAWYMSDFIPEFGAPLRKRGGWVYASPDLSTVKATASYIYKLAHVPFRSANKLVAIDEDGELYTIASSSSATDVGATFAAPNHIFYAFDLLIITSPSSVTPKTFDGSSIASLGGSPPTGYVGTTYANRVVLANDATASTNPNRVWFSAGNNPSSWDTTNRYIDVAIPFITGVAGLKETLLVFGKNGIDRIRGDIPPPGTNMQVDTLSHAVGLPNTKSLTVYEDVAYFCNRHGVFATDGNALSELTKLGGVQSYYQTNYGNVSSSISVYRGLLFVTNLIKTLVFDLDRQIWYEWSHTPFNALAPGRGTSEELYAGTFSSFGAPRVVTLSNCFSPSSAVKSDADGTAVAPTLETPFYNPDIPGKKSWRFVYTTYDTRDSASDNPTLTVSYITSPEATSYTSLTDSRETTAKTRKRNRMGFASDGVAFKLAQSNASSDTYLYRLEADVHGREGSRL